MMRASDDLIPSSTSSSGSTGNDRWMTGIRREWDRAAGITTMPIPLIRPSHIGTKPA